MRIARRYPEFSRRVIRDRRQEIDELYAKIARQGRQCIVHRRERIRVELMQLWIAGDDKVYVPRLASPRQLSDLRLGDRPARRLRRVQFPIVAEPIAAGISAHCRIYAVCEEDVGSRLFAQ